MKSNPYAPPDAAVVPPARAPGPPRGRRPLFVWCMAVAGMVIGAAVVYQTRTWLADSIHEQRPRVVLAVGSLLRVFVLGCIGAATVGAWRGAAWGRRLGLVVIALVFLALLGLWGLHVIWPPADHWHSRPSGGGGWLGVDPAQVIGAAGCGLSLYGYWTFGFSARSRAWFASGDGAQVSDDGAS